MDYALPLTRHYRIWFSGDPAVFLPSLNQLRLIEFRRRNPGLSVSLLYSRTCLGETALSDLHEFCRRLRIEPVCFEELPGWLTEDRDRRLYRYAEEEIRNRGPLGGNLAAASDLTRMILPVIERLGIYADFDLEFDMAVEGDGHAEAKVPVLLPLRLYYQKGKTRDREFSYPWPLINNNFIAVASTSRDTSTPHADAVAGIRRVQEHALLNYEERHWQSLAIGPWGTPTRACQPPAAEFFRQIVSSVPPPKTIAAFRVRMFELCASEPAILDLLLRESVSLMAGPPVWYQLVCDAFRYGGSDLITPYVMKDEFPPAFEPCRHYSEAVEGMVGGPSTTPEGVPYWPSDLSWTPTGARNLEANEARSREKIEEALKALDASF